MVEGMELFDWIAGKGLWYWIVVAFVFNIVKNAVVGIFKHFDLGFIKDEFQIFRQKRQPRDEGTRVLDQLRKMEKTDKARKDPDSLAWYERKKG